MSENKLLDLSFEFAVAIVNLVDGVTAPKSSYMTVQLARAGTSVGANIHEAQNGSPLPKLKRHLVRIYHHSLHQRETLKPKVWASLFGVGKRSRFFTRGLLANRPERRASWRSDFHCMSRGVCGGVQALFPAQNNEKDEEAFPSSSFFFVSRIGYRSKASVFARFSPLLPDTRCKAGGRGPRPPRSRGSVPQAPQNGCRCCHRCIG